MRHSKCWTLQRLAIAVAFAPTILASHSLAATSSEDYVQRAQQRLQTNDLRGAEIELRNAVKQAPNDGSIRLQLAELYVKERSFTAAEAELVAAKQRGITSERLSVLLAEVMYRNGRIGELLRDVPARDRTALNESQIRAYRGLAQLVLGDVRAAEAMLADAERLNPKSVIAKVGLARLSLIKKDVAAASRKIDEAVALAPNDSEALELKGFTRSAAGDSAGALTYFNLALKADPNNVEALLDRGNVYLESGDLIAAEKDIAAALKLRPNSSLATYLSALTSVRRGDLKSANASLERLRAALDIFPEALLLSGIVKYNLDELDVSESFLTRYIAKRKDNAQPYALLGNIAVARGNATRAITMYNQALQLAPKNPQITSFLAQAYLVSGDYGRASALFDEALQIQPDNAALKTQLAVSRFNAGETGAAVSQLKNVFASGADGKLAGAPLVVAALRSSRIDEASKAAEALVAQDSKDLIAQQLLGVVRVSQGRFSDAETIFRSILEKEPNQTTVRDNLSKVYVSMNRSADAKKLYQDTLAKTPNDATALQRLAGLHVRDKDYNNAATLLQRAVIAAPADPAPRFQLVSIYEVQRKWPDAINVARSLSSAFPRNADARLALARIYRDSGDLRATTQVLSEALQSFPDSVPILANYAIAAAAAKDYRTAITAFNKAIRIEPANESLKAGLVDATYVADGADAALALAKRFTTGSPNDAFGDLITAEVLDRSGRRADAIIFLEKSQAASASVRKLLKLTELHLRNGEPKRAIPLLESWIPSHPGDLGPKLQLADLYLTTRDYRAAVVQFERLAAEQPKDAMVLNNLAWLYNNAKDARARKTAEKAWDLAPGLPQVADTLGWVLVSEGDLAGGLKQLQIAAAGLPDSPSVQYHLAVALSKTNKPTDARVALVKALASKAVFDERPEAERLLKTISSAR